MNLRLRGPLRAGLALAAVLAFSLLASRSLEVYRAAEAFDEARSATERGRYDLALARLEAARRLTPGDALVWAETGKVRLLVWAFRRDEPAGRGALEAYREAVRLNPLDGVRHSELAWAALTLGRYREAEQALGQALQKDPHNAYYTYMKGYLRERQGRREEAAALYRRSLEIRWSAQAQAGLKLLEAP